MLADLSRLDGQKAPSAKRCIKTGRSGSRGRCAPCQKAPSAKRCIKTCGQRRWGLWRARGRQKAPSAKRCIKTPQPRPSPSSLCPCQKAPSAKRCIKTAADPVCRRGRPGVRKHRAPKGALRLVAVPHRLIVYVGQKAPSAKRCIKTGSTGRARCRGARRSESTERQKVH